MITEAIIQFIINGFYHLISLFPSFTVGADLLSAFSQLAAWAAWVNYYVPLEDFCTGLAAIFDTWIVSCVVGVCIELF